MQHDVTNSNRIFAYHIRSKNKNVYIDEKRNKCAPRIGTFTLSVRTAVRLWTKHCLMILHYRYNRQSSGKEKSINDSIYFLLINKIRESIRRNDLRDTVPDSSRTFSPLHVFFLPLFLSPLIAIDCHYLRLVRIYSEMNEPSQITWHVPSRDTSRRVSFGHPTRRTCCCW